jgi:hypothetical protein
VEAQLAHPMFAATRAAPSQGVASTRDAASDTSVSPDPGPSHIRQPRPLIEHTFGRPGHPSTPSTRESRVGGRQAVNPSRSRCLGAVSLHKGGRRHDEASSQSGDSRSVLAVSTKLVPTQGRGGRMLRLVTKASARGQALSPLQSAPLPPPRSPSSPPPQGEPTDECRGQVASPSKLGVASKAASHAPSLGIQAQGSAGLGRHEHTGS